MGDDGAAAALADLVAIASMVARLNWNEPALWAAMLA
tara:strand:+ start:6081 stop:6191 length:111 start_codon:yes stop_codon:yes gene_type:complete